MSAEGKGNFHSLIINKSKKLIVINKYTDNELSSPVAFTFQIV